MATDKADKQAILRCGCCTVLRDTWDISSGFLNKGVTFGSHHILDSCPGNRVSLGRGPRGRCAVEGTPALSRGRLGGRGQGELAWGPLEQAGHLILLAARGHRGLRLRDAGGTSASAAQAIGGALCEGGASLDRAVLRRGLKPAAAKAGLCCQRPSAWRGSLSTDSAASEPGAVR